MVYFIPTPIGNLEDISLRSLNLLGKISNIFCEDTRVTKKLISLLNERYDLQIHIKNYISFHSHNENEIIKKLNADELKEQDFAFVSDAGMPCISDPGAVLVKFCQENEIKYEILSGANALLVALSGSGFSETEFSFFGFLPHKGSARDMKLKEVLNSPLNAVLYESPHRIELLADELAKYEPEREVFFIKEISKKHEKKYFGKASAVQKILKNENLKGEWVVVISKNPTPKEMSAISIDDILPLDIKPKQKAKLLSKLSGENIDFWYKKLISK